MRRFLLFGGVFHISEKCEVKLKENEVCSVYEADLPETTEAPDEAIPQN